MNKFKHSFAFKITAVILFAVFLTVFFLSVLGIAILVDNNMFYNSNITFFESKLCKNQANDYAARIFGSFMKYQYANSSSKPFILEDIQKDIYSSDNCNVSFTVKDSDGNIVLSNYDEPNYGFKDDYYYDDKSRGYIVTVSVRANLTECDEFYQLKIIFDIIHSLGSSILIVFVTFSGIFSVLLFILLMCAAGYRKGIEGVSLYGMDKIPFDIFTAAAGCVLVYGTEIVANVDLASNFFLIVIPVTFLCALSLIVYCMSFAARLKAKTLLKNTVIYIVCLFIYRVFKKFLSAFLFVFRNLNVLFKVLLIFGVITLFELILTAFMIISNGSGGLFFLWGIEKVLLCSFICYLTLHLRKLKEGGERIANGDISYRIDTSKMLWDLKKHGENLNNISAGISKAVEERIKSERTKTELITNVSHDIKTPLTSIINYVDLLKKENIENETAKEYLAVIDRQSARLKKMTEDLVEASKASSGSINVSPARTDIKELLSQAVAEYDERLKAVSLEPIVTLPDHETPVFCDGRLLWRVFDNLLSNICKYSLPATRVYLSVVETDGKVQIAFKNISKYPLNISSDELTERFVRGDSSRSTEGSGLGLSIAKSLTELQKGKFELSIDGDLFKVVITFDKMA